jgi:predicted esterase
MSFPAIRVPASRVPSASIIFLHGLGDSGAGWAFLAEEARRQKRLQHVNFVFPTAPNRKVTLNFGMEMSAWYDIPSLGALRTNQDDKGVLESVEILKNLIKEQQDKGIPANRIVIGGFSQGCAISLAVRAIFLRELSFVFLLPRKLVTNPRPLFCSTSD